jgi:hypothetical protein
MTKSLPEEVEEPKTPKLMSEVEKRYKRLFHRGVKEIPSQEQR